MPSFQFQCPGCQTTLKSAGPVESGKQIKCPKCGTVFALAVDAPARGADRECEPAGPARARRRFEEEEEEFDEPPRRRGRRGDDDEEFEDDRPRPRRRKRRRQSAGSGLVLWLVLGGAGLVLLIGVAAALFFLLGGSYQARIVGRWTLDNPFVKDAITMEFRSDGTFHQSLLGNQINGTYSVSGSTLKLNINNALGMNIPGGGGATQIRIVSLTANELVLEGAGHMGRQERMVLKRSP